MDRWSRRSVGKSKRVTNASGNAVSTIELDPWGGETNRSSNEAFQPRKFTTYERDSIGSDEAMHRRYNRWWSRFEQPDPYDGSYDLNNPQSFNRYTYVNNDPINFTDPFGLDPIGGLGGALGDAVAGATIGPGTVTVTVPINDDGIAIESSLPDQIVTAMGALVAGGAPQKTSQEPNFIDRLQDCVKQIYNVDLIGFTAANADTLGKFWGTGFDRYARRDGSILILTNASSFSGSQLAGMNNDYARRYPDKRQPMVKSGDVVGGVTFSFGRAGLIQVSPYVNYLAYDFDRIAKGWNVSGQGSSLFRQVHEVGHSLSDITGRGKGERGDQLTNCVFTSRQI